MLNTFRRLLLMGASPVALGWYSRFIDPALAKSGRRPIIQTGTII